MRAGKMRHRVEVQERTTAQDEYGDAVPTWATIISRWANIEAQGGQEAWQANQVRPDVAHAITMRYVPGLTPKHRLKMGDRIFSIEAATNPDGVRREHRLLCKEEV